MYTFGEKDSTKTHHYVREQRSYPYQEYIVKRFPVQIVPVIYY